MAIISFSLKFWQLTGFLSKQVVPVIVSNLSNKCFLRFYLQVISEKWLCEEQAYSELFISLYLKTITR